VGVGDVEPVDRLLEGEEGVELLARHVEVEVCRLEEGKGTEYLLHGGAEDMVGAHELVGQPVAQSRPPPRRAARRSRPRSTCTS